MCMCVCGALVGSAWSNAQPCAEWDHLAVKENLMVEGAKRIFLKEGDDITKDGRKGAG